MRLSVTSSPILMSPHTRVPLRPLKLPRGCPLSLCPEREGITPWRKERGQVGPSPDVRIGGWGPDQLQAPSQLLRGRP